MVIETEGPPLIKRINIFWGKHQCLNRESASVAETPCKSALQSDTLCQMQIDAKYLVAKSKKDDKLFIWDLELQ